MFTFDFILHNMLYYYTIILVIQFCVYVFSSCTYHTIVFHSLKLLALL